MSNKIINFPKVNNAHVKDLVEAFIEERSNENLTALVNECVKTKFLVPCQINKRDGKNIPVPLTMRTEKGDIFQPMFTSEQSLKDAPKPEAMALFDFLIVADVIYKQKDTVKGIVIDPGPKSVFFNIPLIENILKNEAGRLNNLKIGGPNANDSTVTPTIKVEDMTDEQYAAYQRTLFELNTLPKLFYENPKSLIEKCAEQKENAIDEIYENAYEDIRRYPYLTDEFSVMAMNITDNEKIIYIKMPERDMNNGSLECVYLVYSEENNRGYYFGLMNRPQGASYNKGMVTITDDKKVLIIGEAPAEGNEVTFIRDYIKNHK